MKRDCRVYLRDVLQSFRNAQEFVGRMSYEKFITDKKTVSAVVRELEVAGEASNCPAQSGENIRIFPGRIWQVCGIN